MISLTVVHLLEEYAEELIKSNHFTGGKEVDEVTRFLRMQKPESKEIGDALRRDLVMNPKSQISGYVGEFEYTESDVFYIGLISEPNEKGETYEIDMPCIKAIEHGSERYVFLCGGTSVACTERACFTEVQGKLTMRKEDVITHSSSLEVHKARKYRNFLLQFVKVFNVSC